MLPTVERVLIVALGVTFSVGRSDNSVWATPTGPGGNSISGGSSDSAGGLGVDVNLRGYKEFAAQYWPKGWNTHLTLSPSAAKKPGD